MIQSHDKNQFNLRMTSSAPVVKTSVNVSNNSPVFWTTHLNDLTSSTFNLTSVFKSFANKA